MTTTKAKAKIEKAAKKEMTVNENGLYFVEYNERLICFYANGRNTPDAEITCIHTTRMSDNNNDRHYTYHDNIKQAIDFCKH